MHFSVKGKMCENEKFRKVGFEDIVGDIIVEDIIVPTCTYESQTPINYFKVTCSWFVKKCGK